MRLEGYFKDQTSFKRKMKPNISLDWLTQLRQRLKSGSTQENSSNERNEKSPQKVSANHNNFTSGNQTANNKDSSSNKSNGSNAKTANGGAYAST